MPIYTIKLLKKEEIAQETTAFYFEKPTGFAYTAGQFGTFTLINKEETDERGNRRQFTLASSPFEKYLMIATRSGKSSFKRVLRNLPSGAQLQLNGPFGTFTLGQTVNKPVVFLNGGIGITPARSIINQASFEKSSTALTLLYFNKTQKETSFFSELLLLAQKNPHFTFVPVMTRENNLKWHGETGHLNQILLQKYIPDLKSPLYYISGPVSMVSSLKQLLLNMGIKEDNIQSEDFPGY